MKSVLLSCFGASLILLSSCDMGSSKKELGSSAQHPVKIAIVPAGQAAKALSSAEPLTRCIEKASNLYVKVDVPNSYIAVSEAMGSGQVDVAFGDISSYLIARIKYKAEALLQVNRYGTDYYQSMIFVKSDSPIKTIKDLDGKRFAYSDASSASSYILPLIALKKEGIQFGEKLPTGSMDASVTALLQNKVDAAAAYYNAPDATGHILDARERVLTIFPNIEKDTRIVWKSEHIPNEPIFVRAGLSPELKHKLATSISECVKKFPRAINNIETLTEIDKDNKTYDNYISMLEASGLDIVSVFTKKK